MRLIDANNLATRLLIKHGLTKKGWRFKFDKATKRFGCCKRSKKLVTLSRALTELNGVEVVKDTILHEIAHALDVEDRGRSDHSWKWKRWAIKVGAKPERCYDSSEVNMPRSEYYYVCTACKTKIGRKRKTKTRIVSCPKCSKGFNVKYIMVPNVPHEKAKQLEEGKIDILALPESRAIARAVRLEYPAQYAKTPFSKIN